MIGNSLYFILGYYFQTSNNMDEQNIHYCFTLSEEQLEYLRSKKYKIDRMECFMSLVTLAERETKLVQLSKTQQVEILRGQFMVDNTQLARLWNRDRKTVPKILDAMESLGISSSQKIGDCRIHTLHSLSGWYVDGHFVGNDFALKRNADRSAIIYADVPPARVITIENVDDKDKGDEGSALDGDKSAGSNKGMNPLAVGNVSHPSLLFNNSDDVGETGAETQFSNSAHNNISHQSIGIPSSNVEADGSPNEGKRSEGAAPQHPGCQGGQSDGYQSQPYNGYQKSNGNYHPDGKK